MRPLADIGARLDAAVDGSRPTTPAELLALGEETLEHWVLARGFEPTRDEREYESAMLRTLGAGNR